MHHPRGKLLSHSLVVRIVVLVSWIWQQDLIVVHYHNEIENVIVILNSDPGAMNGT